MTEIKSSEEAPKEAPEDDGKVHIRPDLEKYTSTVSSSGSKSQHSGDTVASALAGLTVNEVATIASAMLSTKETPVTVDELLTRYQKLNIGQQRMNLGNRIRGALNRLEKETEGSGYKALAEVVSPIRKRADTRIAEEKKAADEAKAAKAAEADGKAKAKKLAKKGLEKVEAEIKAETKAKTAK